MTAGVQVTVCRRLGLCETGEAACRDSPGHSGVGLAGGVGGRLADLQVGGRSHLPVVSPHGPHVEQLALLDHDEAEDQEHHPADRGEEADQDALYDGLVQLARLLARPGAHVVLIMTEAQVQNLISFR